MTDSAPNYNLIETRDEDDPNYIISKCRKANVMEAQIYFDRCGYRHPSYPQGDKPIPPGVRLTDSEQLRKDLEIRHIHWQAMDIGGIKAEHAEFNGL